MKTLLGSLCDERTAIDDQVMYAGFRGVRGGILVVSVTRGQQ